MSCCLRICFSSGPSLFKHLPFRRKIMDQRMIINAVHPEECRIAIVEGSALAVRA
jgi:hypothetical protein